MCAQTHMFVCRVLTACVYVCVCVTPVFFSGLGSKMFNHTYHKYFLFFILFIESYCQIIFLYYQHLVFSHFKKLSCFLAQSYMKGL